MKRKLLSLFLALLLVIGNTQITSFSSIELFGIHVSAEDTEDVMSAKEALAEYSLDGCIKIANNAGDKLEESLPDSGIIMKPVTDEEMAAIMVAVDSQPKTSVTQKNGIENLNYNFSNDYFYNQLSSDMKSVYNQFSTYCQLYYNSTTNASSPYIGYVNFSTPVTLQQAHAMVAAFYYSNPQWFFLQNGFSYKHPSGDTTSVLSVAIACYADYQSVTTRKAASNAIETATASILSQAETYPTVLAKERFIAEKLCDTITYNKIGFHQTIYGALVARNCVCNGYAMAFAYLCNALGIECISVAGNNHAWNIIKLYGNWYQVDTTWMDQINHYWETWYNKSYNTFLLNDQNSSHVYDSNYYASLTLPSCTSDIVLVNHAPVANNAAFSVKSGTMISGTVTATDQDGDSITYSKVLSPAHGALSFNSNGTYTYTATSGYIGADSFTFRASDGKDYSNTAVVSITVTGTPTESITVTSPSDSVDIGKTLQMAAIVSPNDATNKSVAWSVNNSTIAAISTTGLLTAKAGGKVTVTATANDGSGVYGTKEITVTVPVSAITVKGENNATAVSKGKTLQMNAVITPANATVKDVTWSVDKTAVATINQTTGLLTGVANGTVTVTATATDGSGKIGTAVISVITGVENITVSSANDVTTIEKGKTLQMSAAVSPADATSKAVTWSVSNTAIAYVSTTGMLTALNGGTVTVTATAKDGTGIKGTMEITITVPLASLTLSPSSAVIEAGDTRSLTAVFYPTNTTNQTITWTSSDESVAAVDSNGAVTAVKAGTARITATGHNGKAGVCAVTVINKPVKTITFEDGTKTSYITGETADLSVTYAPVNATVQSCKWSSSNPNVAIVDVNGKLTAVGEGTAIITALAADGKGAKGTLNITVKSTAKKVVLSDTYIPLSFGGSAALTATVYPTDIKNPTIEWYLGDADGNVITVDGVTVLNGRITARPTSDVKTFYVYAKYGELKARCYVKVSVPATRLVINGYTAPIDMAAVSELPLGAVAVPANCDAIDAVTWSSSNTSVATVDSNGKITPVGAGTALITAKSGRLIATQPIVVTNSSVTLKTLAITPMTVSKLYCNVADDNATLKNSYQLALTGTTTTNAVSESVSADKVIWTSSNTAIATVDSTGKVKAVGSGIATITAQSKGNAAVRAVVRVTVVKAVTGFTFAKDSYTIKAGTLITLRPTAFLPADATTKSIVWTSSDPTIATVDLTTGLVKAIAANENPVTITATSSDGNAKYEITIHVVDPVPVTGITLSNTTLNLKAGSTYALRATIAPDNATNKVITWTSSDTNVATVSSTGLVTVKNADVGSKATITASIGETTVQCVVTVTGTNATGITLNKSAVDIVGIDEEYTGLSAAVLPAAADQTLIWKSADESIVKINSSTGVINTAGYGKTTVTVSNADGRFIRSCTVAVYPIDKTMTLSAVNPRVNLETYTGAQETLQIKDRTGTLCDGGMFTWTVNNNLIEINGIGEIKARNGITSGTSVVTAALTGDPLNRKVSFTVTILPIHQTAAFNFNEMPDGDIIASKGNMYKAFAANSSFSVKATAFNTNNELIGSAAAPAWRSSDTSIAAVRANPDGTCTIKMLKPGIVRIYATANDTKKYSDYFVLNIYDFTPVSTGALASYNTCLDPITTFVPYNLKPVYSTKIDSASIISVYDGRQYISANTFIIDTVNGQIRIDPDLDILTGTYDIAAGTYTITAKLSISDNYPGGNIQKCTGSSSTSVNVTFKLNVVKNPPKITATVASLNLFDTTSKALIKFNASPVLDSDCSVSLKDSTRPGFADNFKVVYENGNWYLMRNTANQYVPLATSGFIEVAYGSGRFKEEYRTVKVNVTVPTATVVPKIPTFTAQSVTLSNVSGYKAAFGSSYDSTYSVSFDNSTAVNTTANQPFSSVELVNSQIVLTLKNSSDYAFAANRTYIAKVKVTNESWNGSITVSLPITVIPDPTNISIRATLSTYSATINTSSIAQKFIVGYNYTTTGLSDTPSVTVSESLDWLNYSVDSDNKNITFTTLGTPVQGTYRLPVVFSCVQDGKTYSYNALVTLIVVSTPTDIVISRPTGSIDVLNRSGSKLEYTFEIKNAQFDNYNFNFENYSDKFNLVVDGNKIVITPKNDAEIELMTYSFDFVLYSESSEIVRKTITFTPVQPALRVTAAASGSTVLHKSLAGLEQATFNCTTNISYAVINSFELSETDKAIFDLTYLNNQISITLKDSTIPAGTYRLTVIAHPNGAVNPQTVTFVINVNVVE